MIDFQKILTNEKKLAKVRPIIFEGLDASGKDYLRLGFSEYTNHRYICVTRMFISSVVYAELYSRASESAAHFNMLIKFMSQFNPCVVYCDAHDGVLDARILQRGEEAVDPVLRAKTRAIYERVLLERVPAKNLVRIDTSRNPAIEHMSKVILETLKTIDIMEN